MTAQMKKAMATYLLQDSDDSAFHPRTSSYGHLNRPSTEGILFTQQRKHSEPQPDHRINESKSLGHISHVTTVSVGFDCSPSSSSCNSSAPSTPAPGASLMGTSPGYLAYRQRFNFPEVARLPEVPDINVECSESSKYAIGFYVV